ncbi:hypothetical protein GW17_00024992 [Ensete ventricosum]|nr:hypothetical protein GW17_00024992 [Ensete ventricosum]
MDAKALRDLEVMKTYHDFNLTEIEGLLVAIREHYSIPKEYALYALLHRHRPYNSSSLRLSISVNALKAGLHFPPHPIIEECLRWGFGLEWSVHSISNVPSYPSEEESALIDRLKGILLSSQAIQDMIEIWLVEAGLSPAPRDTMDLFKLRGIPKVSIEKPMARAIVSSPKVQEVPMEAALRVATALTSKRATEGSTPHPEGSTHVHNRRKADDDLLKAITELEAQRTKLPKEVIEDYKGSIWFKLGLQQMGQVTYEYGY